MFRGFRVHPTVDVGSTSVILNADVLAVLVG
jgi:hypothetical protein